MNINENNKDHSDLYSKEDIFKRIESHLSLIQHSQTRERWIAILKRYFIVDDDQDL